MPPNLWAAGVQLTLSLVEFSLSLQNLTVLASSFQVTVPSFLSRPLFQYVSILGMAPTPSLSPGISSLFMVLRPSSSQNSAEPQAHPTAISNLTLPPTNLSLPQTVPSQGTVS